MCRNWLDGKWHVKLYIKGRSEAKHLGRAASHPLGLDCVPRARDSIMVFKILLLVCAALVPID